MKHIKPTAKGDPLCPLGFHPQVRWPTRCKRCFRDYKEHGNRNKQSDTLRRDDTTASTPALSSWTLPLKAVNNVTAEAGKSWTSSNNLNSTDSQPKTSNDSTIRFSKSSSWMSTPDLASTSNDNKDVTSVTLTRRRRPELIDTGQDDPAPADYRSTQFTVRRRTSTNGVQAPESDPVPLSTTTASSSLRTRNTLTNSTNTPSVSYLRSRASSSRSNVDNSLSDVNVTVHLKAPKMVNQVAKAVSSNSIETSSSSSSASSDDDDYETVSTAGTDMTDATIVADSEYQEQLQSLRKELETLRIRCEKAELEKNDLLLKRLAAMDTSSSKTTASELLKFQQKVNDLKTIVEDLQDEKKVLSTRCKELEAEVQTNKKKGGVDKDTDVLRSKLSAAESLCEELMDENEDMKRELREMEVEMDELQDHFREDQADEYSSLKKELEQTAKNCRILSFKLRKTERKADQMEAEKLEVEKKYREIAGERGGLDKLDKIKKLEKELNLSTEVVTRLQKDLDDANSRIKELTTGKVQDTKKKAPTLSSLKKNSSGEKISRESLTRGGSQDDPVQLLRDLQDSLEREADLREQLRYAEEEISQKLMKVNEDSFPLKPPRNIKPGALPISQDPRQVSLVQTIEPTISSSDLNASNNISELNISKKMELSTASLSTQTLSTRLTSLISQMKSMAIQTDLNVNAEIQTLWDVRNSYVQTVRLHTHSSEMQTDGSGFISRGLETLENVNESCQTELSNLSVCCQTEIMSAQHEFCQTEMICCQDTMVENGSQTETNHFPGKLSFVESVSNKDEFSQTETAPNQNQSCQIGMMIDQNQSCQTEAAPMRDQSCQTGILPNQNQISGSDLISNQNQFCQTELVSNQNQLCQTEMVLNQNQSCQTEIMSNQNQLCQTEMTSNQNQLCQTELTSNQNQLCQTETVLHQNLAHKTEEISKQNQSCQTEIRDYQTEVSSADLLDRNEVAQTKINVRQNYSTQTTDLHDGVTRPGSNDLNEAETLHDLCDSCRMLMQNNQISNTRRNRTYGLCTLKLFNSETENPDALIGRSDDSKDCSRRVSAHFDRFKKPSSNRENSWQTQRMNAFLQNLPPALSFHLVCSNFETLFSSTIFDSPLTMLITPLVARRHSPNSHSRLSTDSAVDKDEGISDEEDPAELRLLLELNEQEAAVLRRKVEELEGEGDGMKKKIADLQEKLLNKSNAQKKEKKAASLKNVEPESANTVYEKKMKVREEEINELRKKLIEKDRDCERLHSELALTKKKPKTLQKSISLDGASETIDLKRQLQLVEQEANILRTKNQTLEIDYEKLLVENKRMTLSKGVKKGTLANGTQFELKAKIASLEKDLEAANKKISQLEEGKGNTFSSENSSEIDKLKSQISKLESEKGVLKRLKEDPITDSVKLYLKRTPKKPTDVMSKVQLKKMVEDLENEIGEILVVLQKSDVANAKALESGKGDSEKTRLKTEVEELKRKLELTRKEVTEQKEKQEKEKEKHLTEKKKIENDKKKLEESLEKERKKLESEKQEIESLKKKLESEKADLHLQIAKLNSEIKSLKTSSLEKGKLHDSLNDQLDSERKLVESLRSDLEAMKLLEEENNKLKKEIKEVSKKSTDYESKFKELEDKYKKSEKLLSSKKEKLSKLEKQLEEATMEAKSSESKYDKITVELKAEKDSLTRQIEKLTSDNEDLCADMKKKDNNIASLEKAVNEEREKFMNLSSQTDSTISHELKKVRDEVTSLKKQNIDLNLKLKEAENSKRVAEETLKTKDKEIRREVHQWELKASELEMDLQAERKMKERLKVVHEQENKTKETEISNLQSKMSQQGINRRLSEVRLDYDKQVKDLEQSLNTERKNYEELTAKYELLEQEHVSFKSQFVMEKETMLSRLAVNEEESRSLESELRALRETYNKKQDEWIKEKLEMQEKLKSLGKSSEKATDNDILQIQLNTLNATLNEKLSEIEQLQRENSMKLSQLESVKKENEELRKKLDDYVKVSQVQRNMSADSSAMDRQLREVKNRLYMEERARKSDLSALKLRYDSRISIIMEELKNSQGQVTRFKRESDNYRHMFESAQKTISDLKSSSKSGSDSRSVQAEDVEDQVAGLEQQLSLLEDELSEARLEGSRLKTELISNKSAFEVKVSEMASRINELEEERLLSSGRTKIPGLKTKLELAWSKEREEQQRILQETSTLARDLRQTLFEMERERDKDRLEAKRKHELLRRTMDEEQEENKRKITELQCDLLELRDAHAKLRTTNEKYRREKERFDLERESLRRMKASFVEDPKLSRIVDLCNELSIMLPELSNGKPNTTIGLVTPPVRRKGPKSRESSPGLEKTSSSREPSEARDDPRVSRMQTIMQQLSDVTQDLRRSQRISEDERRTLFSRRSVSTESENPVETVTYRKGIQRRGSLFRKSLSLEQTSQSIAAADENIWKMEEDNGSYTSFQSLDEAAEPKFNMYQQIDSSLDSRLSGDSTTSERLPSGDKKKKKGLFGKLRKLTKSSSVDREPEYEITSRSQLNPGSDSSLASQGIPDLDSNPGKRNFKNRISDMFKKSGSTSRGNSMERTIGLPPSGSSMVSDSSQRPLIRTSPSPARSDVSSSSASRPLTGTNGKRLTAPGSVPLPRKAAKK